MGDPKPDPYQRITDRLVSMLEEGTAPWRKPWTAWGPSGAPANLRSGKAYRGINVFLLGSTGYGSPYWLTFKQAKERGGHVRRGEKGWPCVFWKWLERGREDEQTGEMRTVRVPLLRVYTVFNVEQTGDVRGVPEPVPDDRTEPERIDAAEAVWKGYMGRPELRHGGGRINLSDRWMPSCTRSRMLRASTSA